MNFLQNIKLFFSGTSLKKTNNHSHSNGFSMLDYNYIDEGIYVGTNQCCVMALADVLKREGITADISLEEHRADSPLGVQYYMWLPTPDHGIPTKKQIALAVETIKWFVSQGERVYIHCKNGHGRSSTFLTLYFMQTRGITFEEAFALIKNKRPGAHIQDVQVAFLKDFDK